VTRAEPADPFGEWWARFGVPARPSRAELVSRGPSGLGDAGGSSAGSCRRVGALRGARSKARLGESGERSDRVLVGPVTSFGRPSGWLGGWPTPSSSLAEAALDGGSGDPIAALRGSRLERRC